MAERRLIVANPHGFCSGVARAVEAIHATLRQRPLPIYCLNEIVHNRQVVEALAARGVVFVSSLATVPRGASVLFSAHGVSPAVRREAEARGLRVVDATCPFVSKVHGEVRRFAREGCTILCVGHRAHEEIAGLVGEAPEHVLVVEDEAEAAGVVVPDPARVGMVTQTTLSADVTAGVLRRLRERFPAIRLPTQSDICYATTNRQLAVRLLAARVDLVLVLGSANSSNTRRLVETARAAGGRAEMLSREADLDALDLGPIGTLGLTSGASTPESFLQAILATLATRGFARVEHFTAVEEDARHFPLPPEVRET